MGTARSMPDNAPRSHRVYGVPKEDISALRDVEGRAPVRPLRDGWAAWATER
jgi:hypothetical protein